MHHPLLIQRDIQMRVHHVPAWHVTFLDAATESLHAFPMQAFQWQKF